MQPAKIARIDLYQKLLDAYEQERFRWEQFKIRARPDFSDPDKVNDYNSGCLAAHVRIFLLKLRRDVGFLCANGG
jgi:hypothetical protein